MWLCLLLACAGDDDPANDTGPTETGESPSDWSIAADQIPGGVMLAAWAPDDNTLWFVGGQLDATSGTQWRLDGDELCYEEGVADTTLWWLHGRAANDLWMVGANGVAIHEVDGVRTRVDLPIPDTLFGVYDDGADVWAVGGDTGVPVGRVWRYDGTDWAQVGDDLPDLVFKVWDGQFVGVGQAYTWDGTQLVDISPADAPRLLTVRGRSADDLYAVGGLQSAVFMQRTGGEWTEPELEPRCVGQPLTGVYTAPGEDIWVTGNFGTMARWDDSTWDCPDAPLTAEHFHAVWKHGEDTWFAGGNLFSSGGNYGTLGLHRDGDPSELEVVPCP